MGTVCPTYRATKTLGRFVHIIFLFCCPSPFSLMTQSPVLYHVTISKESVLVGQMLKFKPDKICTPSLFLSAVLSAFMPFSLSVPWLIEMTVNKGWETQGLCLSDTVWKTCCSYRMQSSDIYSCHWVDQPASFTFVPLTFSQLYFSEKWRRDTSKIS